MDTAQNADALASQFALRVALQTMKERCIVLQRRLIAVEEENLTLRERVDSDRVATGAPTQNGGGPAELLQLRTHVAELNRQKEQLSEHINMVSNENRKLWSRLSQMAKEQGRVTTGSGDSDCTLTQEGEHDAMSSARANSAGANQNLIRSKTFTQHSPNPHLRHKLIASNDTANDVVRDMSMEEVALDTYGDGDSSARDDVGAVTAAEFGFAYLNVDEAAAACADVDNDDETDFNSEAKKCMEGLQEIRREVLKQQNDLNSALTVLESKIALQPCAKCEQKPQKTEMGDKSLEDTDESLNEVNLPNRPTATVGATVASETTAQRLTGPVSQHLNILQEKIKADALNKVCPMCGKLFSSLIPFEAFQQHVEGHFIDDSSDIEPSLERNYEFISHTVGDF